MKIPILTFKNVSISFNSQQIFSNLNLEIFEGDFISVIGKSGAGKSTFLNLILGNILPGSGEIISNNNGNLNSAIVFQEYNKSIFPWYSVYKNLKIVDKTPADNEDVDYYLELVGLLNHKNKFPRQLSGGMQQRLAIARALLFEPTLLLLDEPFGSLDYSLKDDLEDAIFDIYNKMKLTVVNVTHDIESALYLSNRILFLDELDKDLKEIIIDRNSLKDKNSIKLSSEYSIIHKLIANEKE